MMNFRTRLLSLLVLIVSVVMAPAVIAEADESTRQFDIELLIFRNLVGSDAGEVWPVDFSDWFEEPVDSADISLTPSLDLTPSLKRQ